VRDRTALTGGPDRIDRGCSPHSAAAERLPRYLSLGASLWRGSQPASEALARLTRSPRTHSCAWGFDDHCATRGLPPRAAMQCGRGRVMCWRRTATSECGTATFRRSARHIHAGGAARAAWGGRASAHVLGASSTGSAWRLGDALIVAFRARTFREKLEIEILCGSL
jgi:hypothetical protein